MAAAVDSFMEDCEKLLGVKPRVVVEWRKPRLGFILPNRQTGAQVREILCSRDYPISEAAAPYGDHG